MFGMRDVRVRQGNCPWQPASSYRHLSCKLFDLTCAHSDTDLNTTKRIKQSHVDLHCWLFPTHPHPRDKRTRLRWIWCRLTAVPRDCARLWETPAKKQVRLNLFCNTHWPNYVLESSNIVHTDCKAPLPETARTKTLLNWREVCCPAKETTRSWLFPKHQKTIWILAKK